MRSANDSRDRAEQLGAAFNPEATRHIRLTHLDNDGNKKVVTRRQNPSPHDYRTHLDEASRAGPGALGVSPTYGTTLPGRRPRFLTAFSAFDFDAASPEDVQDVVEALAARGVALYLSRGTSDRGAHVYALFEQAVPSGVAFAFARNLTRLFTAAGHRVDKTFPSAASGIGASILLPYRAAGTDGVGRNPLLVPGDLRPLPLGALEHATRVPMDVIESVNAEQLDSDATRHRKRPQADMADPVFRVTVEERRLAPFWRDGRRTQLALGFSGAAAMAGVPRAVATKAIERLELGGPDAPRVAKRVAIVDRTYATKAAGLPVAFARFYEAADVAAPVLRPHHAEVVARLALVDWRRADSLGRSAASARRILRALHDLAARYGRLTEAGVSVTVSRRDLATLSGLAVSTVNAKLHLLIEAGLLRVESRYRNSPREAAGFELLIVQPKSDHSPQEPVPVLGGQLEWSEIVQAKLFSRVGLGPTPGVVAATLEALGPMNRATLATVTGRSPKTILRAITRLEAHDLVTLRTDGSYALATDALERIPAIEARIGVNERLDRRAKRLHHEQREWRLGTARPREAERSTLPTATETRHVNRELAATASGRMERSQTRSAAAPRAGVKLARAPPRGDQHRRGRMPLGQSNTTTVDATGRERPLPKWRHDMPRKQQRRANGEGTVIRRKDGRYEAREPKRVDVSGKVSQRSYYGRTVSEALEKRAEAMRQADAGMTMDAQKTTLGEYITQWMDDIGSNDLRANTLRAYRHALSLTAPIQNLPLASINRQTVKGLFARLARQKEPRKVSNAMRRKAHSKLRSVLREAVWDGLIPANPMEKLRAPLPEEKELVIWQEAELLRFLRSVPADTQAHAMFYVLAFTGLRRGELLGLHWSDLKVFEDGQGALSVNRSIVPDKGRGYAEMSPKTKTSRRDVYITHDVVEVIQRQRRRVDALRAECGEMWEGTPAIFPSEVGTYKDPHNAGRLFRIWLKKAVDQDLVPRIRLHDLRHTHASIMIANGHDAKVVSDRLGHANVAFTLKVYRKLFKRERRAAAFGIEDLERAELHAQSVAPGARIAN